MLEDDEVFCICKKPDDGTFMINCDGCEEWFHGECVKVTEKQSKKLEFWHCPSCVENLNKKEVRKRKTLVDLDYQTVKKPKNDSGWDVVRSKSVFNFRTIFIQLHECPNSTNLSKEIEEALFAITKENLQLYREKFMSLYLNLKKSLQTPEWFNLIFNKEISIEKLVQMSAEDFPINSNLQKEKETILQQSLERSILTEEMSEKILNKISTTPSQLKVQTQDLQTDIFPHLSAKVELQTPQNQDSLDQVLEKMKSRQSLIPTPVSLETPVQKSSNDRLDALLEKMEQKEFIVPTPPPLSSASSSSNAISVDALLEKLNEKSFETPPDSLNNFPALPSKDSIWHGTFTFPKCETYKHLYANSLIKDQELPLCFFPTSEIEIEGRIKTKQVLSYLEQHAISSAAPWRLKVFAIGGEHQSMHDLFQYFHTRNRVGVLKHTNDSIKDAYLLTLPSESPFPAFLPLLLEKYPNTDNGEYQEDPKYWLSLKQNRSFDLLLVVFVLASHCIPLTAGLSANTSVGTPTQSTGSMNTDLALDVLNRIFMPSVIQTPTQPIHFTLPPSNWRPSNSF